MVANAPSRRPVAAARRVGYAIAAALAGILWFLVNVDPGWRVLPFLTGDFSRVLGLVNVSLWVGVVANLVYLMYDPRWFKSLGDVLTNGIGLVVMVRLWQVFPFAVTGAFDWSLVVRITLAVAIAGSIIGILVNVIALFRSGMRSGHAGLVRR